MITLRVFIACLLGSVAAFGQTYRSTISGIVSDPSDGRIDRVKIQVRNEATGLERAVTSNAQGEFQLPSLEPGDYRLLAEKTGFQIAEERVTLTIDQNVRVAVKMQVGAQRADSIAVKDVHQLLRTDTSTVGTIIDNRQILSLPLDGRNFLELSLLTPGVMLPAQGSSGTARGELAVHVNGAREDANNFVLDGVYNGDPKLNGYALNPPVDAVREFEIAASSFDASFGRNAGGQINIVSKSGTNALHGSAYEFFRNGAMDSANYFASGDPDYRRNQFGASAGGALKKNTTFFFVDYEGRRVREGVTQTTTVPTALERIGDFSRSDPRRPPIDIFQQNPAPFPGNKIPATRLHPIGVGVASLFPLPNRDGAANFTSSPNLTDADNHFDIRADHKELTFRYSFGDDALFNPFSGTGFALVPGYGTSVDRRAQNVMLAHVHALRPNLLNEARVSFNRVSLGTRHETQGTSVNRKLGLPELSSNPRDWGLTFIKVNGLSPIGDEYNNPQHGTTNTFQFVDQVAFTHGRHLAKFGVEVRSLQQNAYRDVLSRGLMQFVGFTGNGLSELLQGITTVSSGATLDNAQHLRTASSAFFLHDTYRVRPNLTLMMGLRYEYNQPAVDAFDRANLYDPTSRGLVRVGTGSLPRGGYNADANNFAPRIGLAYQLGGNVIRASYGIYHDYSPLAPGEALYFSPPYYNSKLYFFSAQSPLFINDPFPASFPYPTPPSVLTIQKDLKTPYVQQWNFSMQRRLGASRMLEIGYVGSKGTKLLAGRDFNQPAPSTAELNLRPNFFFGDITAIESRANSSYNSLQARFEQRMARGLTALVSYTLAKSIDNASNFFASAGDPNFPMDSNNTSLERGRSSFDSRQRLSLAYTYDLPGKWLKGWQTNGVWSFQSGRPFTVILNPDLDNSNTGRNFNGSGGDRPNRIGNGTVSSPSQSAWFDTKAFTTPRFGSFGNSGRNILDGPGFATVNASLLKNIVLKEAMTLQFRVEAFNLLNRTNFNLPDAVVGSPTFGQVLSSSAPRHVQLGVKFLF